MLCLTHILSVKGVFGQHLQKPLSCLQMLHSPLCQRQVTVVSPTVCLISNKRKFCKRKSCANYTQARKGEKKNVQRLCLLLPALDQLFIFQMHVASDTAGCFS